MLVITGAGILLVRAFRTLQEVEIEFLGYGLGIRFRLDLNDNGKVVSVREGNIRNQDITLFRELHPGRIGAVAANHANDLFADRLRLFCLVDRCDLDLAIIGYKEFEVGFDGGKESSSVRAVLDSRMTLTVLVIIVGMVIVFLAVVLPVAVISLVAMITVFLTMVMIVVMIVIGAGGAEEGKRHGGE